MSEEYEDDYPCDNCDPMDIWKIRIPLDSRLKFIEN